MTALLLGTSVLIKWFHEEGETEYVEARAIRDAHVIGELEVRILDLALYEFGNSFLRSLHWSANEVTRQLEDLVIILGQPIAMESSWFGSAADLAETHGLTFYDACWAAAARRLQISLVSADRQLLGAGVAESITDCVARLQLRGA